MSRRRKFLSLLALSTATLAACGSSDGAVIDDVLFLRAGAGVAVVKAGASVPSFRGTNAVPSTDWSVVVRASRSRGETLVRAQRSLSQNPRWERTLTGRFFVKVVSHGGDLSALGPVWEKDYRRGRARTTMVVVGSRLAEPLTFDLKGNFEPEAFSTDGNTLFLVRYLPSRNPTRYQVRKLDLASGEVEGVYTPDSHLQQAMGGTARVQAGSSDGTRLYTLYTVTLADGRRNAFVHVLDLEELWAHCIDLPDGFADQAGSASAITVSPDGARAFVTNSAAGEVAEIDAELLRVTRTAELPFGSVGTTHATVDRGSTLYVARGGNVVAVEAERFEVQETWSLRKGITGLQVSPDARRLFVGMSERVAIIDLDTGQLVRTIDPPGIGKIAEFGPVIRPARAPRTLRSFSCAC